MGPRRPDQGGDAAAAAASLLQATVSSDGGDSDCIGGGCKWAFFFSYGTYPAIQYSSERALFFLK
jgi:hypothetical protein